MNSLLAKILGNFALTNLPFLKSFSFNTKKIYYQQTAAVSGCWCNSRQTFVILHVWIVWCVRDTSAHTQVVYSDQITVIYSAAFVLHLFNRQCCWTISDYIHMTICSQLEQLRTSDLEKPPQYFGIASAKKKNRKEIWMKGPAMKLCFYHHK